MGIINKLAKRHHNSGDSKKVFKIFGWEMNKMGVMIQCNKQSALEMIPILSEFNVVIFIITKLLKQICLLKWTLLFLHLSDCTRKYLI